MSLVQYHAPVARGSSSVILHVWLFTTTDAAQTGLTSASSGLVCARTYVGADLGDGFPASASLEELTIGAGTWEAPTNDSTIRFAELDAQIELTRMPGLYELHIPNSWLVPEGPWRALEIVLRGFSGMRQANLVVPLTGVDFNNADTGGIGGINKNLAAMTDSLLLTGEAPPLLAEQQAEWLGTADTIWHVQTDGSDSNDGTSPGTAFLTYSKAVSVAQPGDAILFGAGTFTITAVKTPPRGVKFIGRGKTLTTISAAATFGSPINYGNGGHVVYGIKFDCQVNVGIDVNNFTAWDCEFKGGHDILLPTTNYPAAHNRLYRCDLTSNGGTVSGVNSQDGLTCSGGITDLYECTITLPATTVTTPSSAVRCVNVGTMVRMFGGSITSLATVSEINGVQCNSGGTFIGIGVTVSTPANKNDFRDSTVGTTDHTGTIIIDSATVYDVSKVVGEVFILPSADTDNNATRVRDAIDDEGKVTTSNPARVVQPVQS